jgi:NTP pyrophosphatase (non-canonical NTP hydrolase)
MSHQVSSSPSLPPPNHDSPSFLHRLRAHNLARIQYFGYGLNDWSSLEWAGAASGEVGEATNVAKKIRRLDFKSVTSRNHNIDGLRQDLADEISDALTYLDILAAQNGIDLEEAMKKKFNEVSERVAYPHTLN